MPLRIRELELRNWRNLHPTAWHPGSGINLLWGGNAQGKTNLLEAVYFLATLRSFRAGTLEQMVRWGEERLSLRAVIASSASPATYEVVAGKGSKVVKLDGRRVTTLEEYFGGFQVVIFTPEHLSLVRGEPALRRSFVDRVIFNVDPSYLATTRRYQRVLRERNATLKRALGDPRRADDLLEAYDPQLARLGSVLVRRRREFLHGFLPVVRRQHAALTARAKSLDLGYLTEGYELPEGDEVAIEEAIRQALGARRGSDLRRGRTSVGPHQDDFQLLLDEHPARFTASQGEARTLVLALKLAEVRWIEERRGEYPILLLDDIGSELDAERRTRLFERVAQMECQTFLTTATPGILPEVPGQRVFSVRAGHLEEPSEDGR